jgi:hypothetical protein
MDSVDRIGIALIIGILIGVGSAMLACRHAFLRRSLIV